MDNEYIFRINVSGRGARRYNCNTKINLTDNKFKVNFKEDCERVISPIKNKSGEYDISQIRKIGFSNIILIFKGILIAIILFIVVSIALTIINGFETSILVLNLLLIFAYIFCCKITTIKIELKNGEKIHIPIKSLGYESIEDKQNAKEIIKTIQEKIC